MRPIKLTMTGFGPYAKETTVDFEKLGEKGLYLITGDTGAGKTTIFDAITYALFGKASGDNRAEDMLRSKYADIGTPTEVTLVFEYAGKRYTVKRSPEYERPKKRGEGTTTEKAGSEAAEFKGQDEKSRQQLTEKLPPEWQNADLDTVIASARQRYSELVQAQKSNEKALIQTQNDLKRKAQLDEQIPQQEKALEANHLYCQELEKKISAEQAQSEERQRQIDAKAAKLKFADKKALSAEITRLQKERQAIQNGIETAQKAYELANEKCSLCEGRVNQLSEKISQAVKPDKEKLLARQKALQEQIQALNNEQESISARLEANRGAAQSIDRQIRELEALQHKLSWLQALSDTANGTASGKAKIMLETYVQMNYFDSIIRKANVRLMTMSGGQYELERRREADNKQSKFGLELDVIDHYNGSRRDVRTLSGGESFKAALSLALGLADVIQSSAGGIRLYTLFVDEGFGNLDEVSLKQALKALRNLAEETRLVGIISHVTDLKQNIDKQIAVTKERDCGSRVEVIV